MNPGLPLTDNQRARQQQIKDADKKRAVAAKSSSSTVQPQCSGGGSSGSTLSPAAAAARLSSPLSPWAAPCNNWAKGECTCGVSCHFHHAGFPVDQKRCFLCGSSEHASKVCPRPGDGADPETDLHWQAYRERRKQAEEAGKTGKDSKGGGQGKKDKKGKGDSGKVGGPGKGPDNRGNRQQPKAGACVDLARAAVAEADAPVKFPRDGVALGSWANVWLKHQRNPPSSYYQDTLHLAYGE